MRSFLGCRPEVSKNLCQLPIFFLIRKIIEKKKRKIKFQIFFDSFRVKCIYLTNSYVKKN